MFRIPESEFRPNQHTCVDNYVGEHNHTAISIIYEQQSNRSHGTIDSDATIAFLDDRIHASDQWQWRKRPWKHLPQRTIQHFYLFQQTVNVRKTTVLDVMRRLLQPKNMMVSTGLDKTNHHCYISILNIIQVSESYPEQDSWAEFQILFNSSGWGRSDASSQIIATHPWTKIGTIHSMGSNQYSGGIVAKQSICAKQSSCIWSHVGQSHEHLFGNFAFQNVPTNHSALIRPHSYRSQLFERVLNQYDKLRKRGAFLDQFKKEDMFKDDLSELDESREVVDNLVQEYEAATQANYLSWQGTDPIVLKCVSFFVYFQFSLLFQPKSRTHRISEWDSSLAILDIVGSAPRFYQINISFYSFITACNLPRTRVPWHFLFSQNLVLQMKISIVMLPNCLIIMMTCIELSSPFNFVFKYIDFSFVELKRITFTKKCL